MNIKKVVGFFLVGSVLVGLFAATAIELGVFEAFLIWTLAAVLTVVLILGVYLFI